MGKPELQVSKVLLQWIYDAFKAGYDIDDVRDGLLGNGYTVEQVEAIFSQMAVKRAMKLWLGIDDTPKKPLPTAIVFTTVAIILVVGGILSYLLVIGPQTFDLWGGDLILSDQPLAVGDTVNIPNGEQVIFTLRTANKLGHTLLIEASGGGTLEVDIDDGVSESIPLPANDYEVYFTPGRDVAIVSMTAVDGAVTLKSISYIRPRG